MGNEKLASRVFTQRETRGNAARVLFDSEAQRTQRLSEKYFYSSTSLFSTNSPVSLMISGVSSLSFSPT
jgi:hypothetical protein